MKRYFFKSVYPLITAAVLLLSVTGCVKDEAFDNNEYGINNPAGQPKGVLFQQSKVDANGVQVPAISSFESVNTPQTVQTLVKIAADAAVTSDLTVKIALNDGLLTGTDLSALDPVYYSIPSEVVIPAGEKFAQFVVTVPDATIIDPSVVYGIGLSITSVDAGYTIASNSKDIVIGIAIKNQWDGTYSSTGYVYHPSVPRPVEEEKVLATVSANSVSCYWGDLGTAGYVALLTIDPVTNKVSISDYSTGIPIEGFDDGLPTTNPGYTPKWDGSPLCNNTYDPATKTFYLRMAYVGSTGYRVTEEILVRK